MFMENRVDKEISFLLNELIANKNSLVSSKVSSNIDFLVEKDIEALLMPFKLTNRPLS